TYPNGHKAVLGVSAAINDGEFVVLVGASGCGKSTVLRMIAGLEDITGGSISIDGRVVNEVAPKDRDIAMVFQNYALYPHMSVRRNMSLALELRGMKRADIDTRVNSTAAMLGIEMLLDRKPGQLSGGQRQRVAVGRAIVREPKVFLFDEPLSNLDAKLRLATRIELKALHRRLRTTSIYVTHDQEEAMTLGERIMVLHKGVVQQFDTPLNVYHHPANRFVAGFIGTPPMNFVPGTVSVGGPTMKFEGTLDDSTRVAMNVDAAHVPLLEANLKGSRDLVLGLRPTSFELRAGPGAWTIPVRVVEVLGDTMDIYGTGAKGFVARVPARGAAAPVDSASLCPLPAEAAWFAPGDEGRSLLKSQ
ncbi:MAG: sn-glycerol-3-phosphate ABC transporter ATP-binding protein UgpC, partial [Phycisphaerales bacterium]